MAEYFLCDEFENDEFESDKFIVRTYRLFTLKLVIFKLVTPKIHTQSISFVKVICSHSKWIIWTQQIIIFSPVYLLFFATNVKIQDFIPFPGSVGH